jgi:hypothetical protein
MLLVRQVNPNDFFGEAQNLKETIGLVGSSQEGSGGPLSRRVLLPQSGACSLRPWWHAPDAQAGSPRAGRGIPEPIESLGSIQQG